MPMSLPAGVFSFFVAYVVLTFYVSQIDIQSMTLYLLIKSTNKTNDVISSIKSMFKPRICFIWYMKGHAYNQYFSVLTRHYQFPPITDSVSNW